MDSEITPPALQEWLPEQICGEPFTIGSGHACVVLNRPIILVPHVVLNLWHNAKLRCTVDGGTNHWLDFVLANSNRLLPNEERNNQAQIKPPDLITGDFDSITTTTAEFFHAIPKIHTPDQSETDFTKAIRVMEPILNERGICNIAVFHDHSGRFDHVMANINTLFKMQTTTRNIFLINHTSITWLLLPGIKHSIQIPIDFVTNQRWCALMPVGAPATDVTTIGLKWNLSHETLAFGSMVSTSNTYTAALVQIETNGRLLWSMGAFNYEKD